MRRGRVAPPEPPGSAGRPESFVNYAGWEEDHQRPKSENAHACILAQIVSSAIPQWYAWAGQRGDGGGSVPRPVPARVN